MRHLSTRHCRDGIVQTGPENGRLGYVTHTYTRGNFYQEIGTFFIGIAPLMGGTTVLLVLLMIFFPDIGKATLFPASTDLSIWAQVGVSLQELFRGLFSSGNLFSFRLWLFLYLVICVGSHMAPSMSDYEGGPKGRPAVVGDFDGCQPGHIDCRPGYCHDVVVCRARADPLDHRSDICDCPGRNIDGAGVSDHRAV